MVEGNPYQRIDVIFDKYHSVSIKNPERMKRGDENAPAFANILPGHKISPWKKSLKGSQNKSSLIKFFIDEWRKED